MVEELVQVEELGELQLKGISRPVPALNVTSIAAMAPAST
jgi:class 3 adenylate cyclase